MFVRVNFQVFVFFGCVPFGKSKNGFFILDFLDFAVERNVKSEMGFVTWQPFANACNLHGILSMTCFTPCRILWSAVRITTMEHKQIKKEAC